MADKKRRLIIAVCKSVGATILIDDHLGHGVDALNAELEKVIVFGDYPWNQEGNMASGMVRCKDWTEVLKELEAYAG